MTTKNILKGLRYRLKNLKGSYKVLIKPENGISPRMIQEYETRIDEIESMVLWITMKDKKKGKKK